MAIVSNLTVDQGATFNAQIDISDDSGNTQNLTGYSVAGQIRKSYDSTTYTAFSASVSNATGGTVSIALTAAQTNALISGRYVYDVKILNAGREYKAVEGTALIRGGVTR